MVSVRAGSKPALMCSVDLDVADAYVAVGAAVGDDDANVAGFDGCDGGFGDGLEVVGVGAYGGPRLAVEAGLDGSG